jgi:hypothetical protein
MIRFDTGFNSGHFCLVSNANGIKFGLDILLSVDSRKKSRKFTKPRLFYFSDIGRIWKR